MRTRVRRREAVLRRISLRLYGLKRREQFGLLSEREALRLVTLSRRWLRIATLLV